MLHSNSQQLETVSLMYCLECVCLCVHAWLKWWSGESEWECVYAALSFSC